MTIVGRAALMLAAGALLAGAGAARAATAADLFYDRAVMLAADAACRLFTPPVAASLGAATAQARGAALRSGLDPTTLDALQSRAAAAARAGGCVSPGVAAEAARVRAAFDGYARLDRMSFPGELAGWLAERAPDDGWAHWRVSQRVRFGWDVMVFGLTGKGPSRPVMALASFADGASPYAARLVVRDAAVTTGPYLDQRAGDVAGCLPLDARLPPRAESRVFAAEAMSPAGRDLEPADLRQAWAFRFPPAAAEALARLDPREAVAVEFLLAGDRGEAVRTAYVEVGDFAAAKAFQDVAQR
jgi:hypothetical protein